MLLTIASIHLCSGDQAKKLDYHLNKDRSGILRSNLAKTGASATTWTTDTQKNNCQNISSKIRPVRKRNSVNKLKTTSGQNRFANQCQIVNRKPTAQTHIHEIKAATIEKSSRVCSLVVFFRFEFPMLFAIPHIPKFEMERIPHRFFFLLFSLVLPLHDLVEWQKHGQCSAKGALAKNCAQFALKYYCKTHNSVDGTKAIHTNKRGETHSLKAYSRGKPIVTVSYCKI